MTQETITRIKLIAAAGMTLTDGETFGKTVYLGTGDAPERWHEIPDAEAAELQKEGEAQADGE